MNALLSILATTKSGAVIEIIILLIVAGAIAFLTSYYYTKSVYMKKIKILESEKDELRREISEKASEIMRLEKQIRELKEEKDDKKDKKD